MIALLFEAETGKSIDITPANGQKMSFRALQGLIGKDIQIMFSDLFENQIIVMNKYVYERGHSLFLNEEMTGCFNREMYGNVIISEERFLPIETWKTHFLTGRKIMYHKFGQSVVVSYNLETNERCLIKNGTCIDSVICGEDYTTTKHYDFLKNICVDLARMSSFKEG